MLTNWTSGPSLPAISPTWGTGVAPSDDCLLSSTPWHWSFQHRPARSTLARPALSATGSDSDSSRKCETRTELLMLPFARWIPFPPIATRSVDEEVVKGVQTGLMGIAEG